MPCRQKLLGKKQKPNVKAENAQAELQARAEGILNKAQQDKSPANLADGLKW